MENSTFLARIALEWKLIRPAQFDECLRLQEEARARGKEVLLGQLLIDRGWLKAGDVDRILKEQRTRLESSPGLSRYELRQRVGEGATAVVYHAWDRELGRPVAIKLLREDVSLDPVGRERFQREVQAAMKLYDPHLVTVYDAGEAAGRHFLVMELVKGRPLSEILKQRRPQERECVLWIEQAARGVGAAHRRGIIHRDLKPANLLITASGETKVTDFGLARVGDSGKGLTAPGSALGTPMYMAPEQVAAKTPTPSTDVYALGVILYEALTGAPPHVGRSEMEIYRKTMLEPVATPSLKNPKITPELDAIVLKALRKAPDQRHPDAGAMAEDLQRLQGG